MCHEDLTMRRLFICCVLLGVVPLLLPSLAVGQKKAGKPKLEDSTDQDYDALRKMKDVYGTLLTFESDGKSLTLRYDYNTYEPLPAKGGGKGNQQYNALLRQQQQLMRDYQNIMNARNPGQQQQRMQTFMNRYQQFVQRAQQLGYSQLGKYKTIPHYKEFDFDVAPDLKVARAKLPMEYDDKGNIKEYTKEELKKMRDPNMPGYTAKIEDLQAGQQVKLYLGKPKKTKKKSTTDDKSTGEEPKKTEPETKKAGDEIKSFGEEPKGTGKGSDKGAKDDAPERPYVRMILILADPDPADPALKQKKRKKKDAD
jgi:hypothetical protein